MDQQFLRTEMLLGEEAMKKLSQAHIAVFGLGGVGSWCAEALVRAGVSTLTLVDDDMVSPSNINRQVQATHSSVGQPKAIAMSVRLRDINPNGKFVPKCYRYSAAGREDFFPADYDYVVDAIDLVSCKLDLIETSIKEGIPIVSALGTGNKLDASLFTITDISKTSGCPLARIIRKELRARGINHHKVVYSPELAAETTQPEGEAPPPGRRSVPASASWVPPVAGFLLAQTVIQDLIAK